MTDEPLDPIRRTAELVTAQAQNRSEAAELERRLKLDIFNSIGRIKPNLIADVDFDKEVVNGEFFSALSAPLQGIAIARCEGALAFYNRIGWHPSLLTESLDECIPKDGQQPLTERYHATTLHDLAYVHPKHFEKMLGKSGSASMWETLKRHVNTLCEQSSVSNSD